MSLRITILYGSYRENRQGIRACHYLQKALEKEGHKITLVDAMSFDLPILSKRYVDYDPGTAPQNLEDLHTLFADKTDAFVVVSGEYNSTMQPGLKNLMDHFYKEFFHKPVGIVTYSMGALGGVRASVSLRNVMCVFGLSPIPTILGIGKIHEALDENGHCLDDTLDKKAANFTRELAWYGNAFYNAHEKGAPHP